MSDAFSEDLSTSHKPGERPPDAIGTMLVFTMVYNVNTLGLEGTANIIRQLVADQSGPEWTVEKIADDEPVLTAGVGMTSLEAVEFLVELEKKFGIKLHDLNWWIYDTPTIRQVAQQLIDVADQPDFHVSRKPR